MQVSGAVTYQGAYATSTPPASPVSSGREDRAATPSTIDSRQSGDSVTISPQARTKADEEKIKREVEQLKRDEERVKAHEAAHKAAGGQYAGSVSYSYRPGPDGRSYIVGGEVQIDVAPGRTPQETISKMQAVIRAAMAPADPSGQDRAVAAQAVAQMAEAQQQLAAGGGEGASSDAVSAASSALQTSGASASAGERGDRNAPGRGERASSNQHPFSTYA